MCVCGGGWFPCDWPDAKRFKGSDMRGSCSHRFLSGMDDSKIIPSSHLLVFGQSLPWEAVLPPYNSCDFSLCNQNGASSQERNYRGVESLEQHRVGRGAEISLGVF